ncbi:MAG: SpoIIE family protein phosphatase [Candidatus Latescibacteria bacterium]|nr:SpoIIE family protein phosphatase [Candidatus Latescibacterota bacterium]
MVGLNMMRLAFGLSWLFLVFGYVTQSAAHTGAVAGAPPVEGIVVDGDLADWPDHIVWYPISQFIAGDRTENNQDLNGRFAAGYNVAENALYVAVEANDEALVLEADRIAWNTVDGCELYVEPFHTKGDILIGQYYIWSDLADVGFGNNKQAIRVAAKRHPQLHRYEWRVDLNLHSQGEVQLRSGMIIGLDIVLLDKDHTGTRTHMAWAGQGGRFSSLSLGDVVLLQRPATTGRLKGELIREDGQPAAHRLLQLHSLDDPERWLRGRTNAKGGYEFALPSGRYQLETGGANGPSLEVMIENGGLLELPRRTLAPPRGQVTLAGPGRSAQAKGHVVPAGPGIWQGNWRILGVADGLPDATVTDVFQDRAGHLWLATAGGVGRYDGEQITVYTKADGLGADAVSSIHQTVGWDLWFLSGVSLGLGGGATRFDGETFTNYTIQDGLPGNYVYDLVEDGNGHLWLGTDAGLCLFDGETFTTYTVADGLSSDVVTALAVDQPGNLWIGTRGGLDYFDGQYITPVTNQGRLIYLYVTDLEWDKDKALWLATTGGVLRYQEGFTAFSTLDGLSHSMVADAFSDDNGYMWFGSYGGVDRFDGKTWTSFSPAIELSSAAGLKSNLGIDWGHQSVSSIFQDRSGSLWFGTGSNFLSTSTAGKGAWQYKGEVFKTYPLGVGVMSLAEDPEGRIWLATWDGVRILENGQVRLFPEIRLHTWKVFADRQGRIWFAMSNGRGVYAYDHGALTHFTEGNGLINNRVTSFLQDRDGGIWLGSRGGASRFTDEGFTHFTVSEGLIDNEVIALEQDLQGHIWLGTPVGASRYDGYNFSSIGELESLEIREIEADSQGIMWIGTRGDGIIRYDGHAFTHYTVSNGLAHNNIEGILADGEGGLWISTFGSGVSRFDGRIFQSLTQRDGLLDNGVHQVIKSRDGTFWVATEEGLTGLRPGQQKPHCQLTRITADRQYDPNDQIVLKRGVGLVSFHFRSQNFQTRLSQMAYSYRLQGYDADWQTTRETEAIYRDLPIGDYLFEVRAVDRDLNYSEPAAVRLKVQPPYSLWGLYGLAAFGLIGFALASGVAVRRGRAYLREQRARLQVQEILNQELEDELQTASELQLGLMPVAAPIVPGFSLAGHCQPASHVSGDFYQYLARSDGGLVLCLADVTGHAMDAAIPMVQFAGILESEGKYVRQLAQLFVALNQTLYQALSRRTYVCCAMVELIPAASTVRLANAGCPFPFHFQAASGQVIEHEIATYPLGARAKTKFPVIDIDLSPGDRLVLCSDGIIEAANAQEELFGFERTRGAIAQGCREGLTAEGLIDRLLTEVGIFTGGRPPEDDMTCVALRVE